jgi:hypothetical protein
MSPISVDSFCQLQSDAHAGRKTLGQWFQTLFVDKADWEVESESLTCISQAEDYIVAQLLEVHELPAMSSGDCPFSMDELCRMVQPSVQSEIWEDMVAKFFP